MKFCTLTENEYENFVKNHEQESFFQTLQTASLRKSYGSIIHLLGVKENNKVIAASMISETDNMFSKKTFYAPHGFILDYHNFELLKFFTDNLKKYTKERNAMLVKIDPNLIYQVRDINGNEKENAYKDDETINNLKKLGYKHFGFTKDYKFTQSRWNFRLTLDRPYEELKKNFSKSTRKNIESTYNKGVRIRKGKLEDLESMEEILIATAQRKKFKYRSLEYYTRMYEHMGDLMQIYIAYLDPQIYLESSKKLLEKEQQNNLKIQEKMKKDMIGSKLQNQKETSDKLIEKYKNELKLAEEFANNYPNGKDIGVLISLKSGNEYLTLYSGILVEYKKFTPKYLMYDAHIKDAYEYGFKYVDFYGISGRFNKDDPDYGMYEFKRGFGGEVIELVGEFTLKISNLYCIYMFFRKSKILLRKIIKR